MKLSDKKCSCEGGSLIRFMQPIILSLLLQGEDYGYSIQHKVAKTALWQGEAPDAAGLYRVLRDMEKRELLVSHIDAAESAGMNKRIFSITETGKHCLRNWLETLTEYRENLDQTITMLQSAIALADTQT